MFGLPPPVATPQVRLLQSVAFFSATKPLLRKGLEKIAAVVG
jgi:hypothetical protein